MTCIEINKKKINKNNNNKHFAILDEFPQALVRNIAANIIQ